MKTDCIVGKGELTRLGYIRVEIQSKKILAHRLAYEKKFGQIPQNMEIDHLCHNKSCVNVDHLEAVTHQVNCQRRKNAKLNSEKVKEIKNLLKTNTNYLTIAKKFGVSKQMIYRINKGLAWA
jgi:hypothetical protein